jgi:hypothetical protein
VLAKIEFKRKFITDNFDRTQKWCDVKFDYRKYEIFANFKYDSQSSDPK